MEFGPKAKSTGHAVVKGKSCIMSVCYWGLQADSRPGSLFSIRILKPKTDYSYCHQD